MARKIKRRNKRHKKTAHLKILLGLGVLVLLLGGFLFYSQRSTPSRIASTEESFNVPKNSLQLGSFYPSSIPTSEPSPTTPPIINVPTNTPIPTSPPPPVNYCTPDTPHQDSCTCIPSEVPTHACEHLIDRLDPSSGLTFPDLELCSSDSDCSGFNAGRCLPTCLGKPVIYLYPEKDMHVNVHLATEGVIAISDPVYPTGGWKNILAHPGGKFEYNGKMYDELFYETSTVTLKQPSQGIIIKSSELKEKLQEYITLLGLTKTSEQEEFLDWWIPRLTKLNSPYILFSILEPSEKMRLDTVEITPKPDTFIDFIAYFKPLSKPEQVEPLIISPAPKRTGFTAVEWGGVIDNN